MTPETKHAVKEIAGGVAKLATGSVVVVTALGYFEPIAGRHFAREALRWAELTWRDIDNWVEKDDR